jgi:hypothetical protein
MEQNKVFPEEKGNVVKTMVSKKGKAYSTVPAAGQL